MDRKTFLRRASYLGAGAWFDPLMSFCRVPFSNGQNDATIQFLGADQSVDQIILSSGKPDVQGTLSAPPIWKFLPDFRPTDAKRYDLGNQIKILVASHGAVYEVPFSGTDPVIWALTYPSCHSVEKMPDGNLVSANSNDGQLTIHFGALHDNSDRIKLNKKVDFPFETAHGVVYDKNRNLLWALGKVLGKFRYERGKKPQLVQLDTYPLPHCHTDGHDLFPLANGNLLITTHEGILELEIGNFANAIEKSDLDNVKSAVGDLKDTLYVTDPEDIPGYESWQTDTIIDLQSGKKLNRLGAKFYKVRLWSRNLFSYG